MVQIIAGFFPSFPSALSCNSPSLWRLFPSRVELALASVAQLVGALGCGFSSHSGHTPELQAPSPARAQVIVTSGAVTYNTRCRRTPEVADLCFSLSLPPLKSNGKKKMSSGEEKNKQTNKRAELNWIQTPSFGFLQHCIFMRPMCYLLHSKVPQTNYFQL